MIKDALNNLRNNQEQCDFDGVFVKVSRQALDEVLDAFEEIHKTAYKEGWNDREDDLIMGINRIMPGIECGNGGLTGYPYDRNTNEQSC